MRASLRFMRLASIVISAMDDSATLTKFSGVGLLQTMTPSSVAVSRSTRS